ncbi:MAG: AtpZ/AtpI family protein [Flavobacteriales bacterium]|nr:AtpZ/AtpI family protein [Flavobacteriales bacterium]
MGAVIYLFSYLGGLLDSYFKTESKTYTLILVIIGFLLSLFSLVVQLNKMNKDE